MGAKPALLPSVASELRVPSLPSGNQWAMTLCTFSSDLLTLSLVFALTLWVRHLVSPTYNLSSNLEMFPCLLLLLCAFGAKGLYPGVLLHSAEELRRIFACISTVFLLLAATTFIWHNAETYSRSIFLVTWAAGAPLVWLSRNLLRRLIVDKTFWGIPAIVLGSGPSAQRVIRKLQDGALGIKIAGVFSDDAVANWPSDLPPLIGALSAARSITSPRSVNYAIIAMPQRSHAELRHVIQDYCQGFSHVLLVPDMPGLCSLGISARELGGEVGFELPQRLFHTSAAITKRATDLVLSLLALVILAPLFLAVALLIKLTSPGTVFYKQDRYGRNGQLFGALKFRTMGPNAEAILTEHLAKDAFLQAEWERDRKLKRDPRITSIGKWLRRFSLDELPQLINVISGQMSLVGPRPIPLRDLEKYGTGYILYSRVRPGLTGLWQVSGRNNTTYEERIAFDEYYVRNWSIWLDTYILIRTIRAVITADGAY